MKYIRIEKCSQCPNLVKKSMEQDSHFCEINLKRIDDDFTIPEHCEMKTVVRKAIDTDENKVICYLGEFARRLSAKEDFIETSFDITEKIMSIFKQS